MEFNLTSHARAEMERRQILPAWVEAIMAAPEQVLAGAGRRTIRQSRIVADGKTYLVRVVVEEWRQPPVVVTVYRTSKIEKYWSPA